MTSTTLVSNPVASTPLVALDLFAGTGWGVACRRLGIREMGVDNMPEVVATREANGMATIFLDVWEGLTGKLYVPMYNILIASPPCQTFSTAGKGAGRKALDEVLEAIHLGAYKDPAQLIAFGERHDMRTALVLAPLAYIWRDRPQYVALEQVPAVLPVWEAYAVIMRQLGYSVQVANLHAEQYGVPQTRKRAILVARLDGPVSLPVPTHSKYYSRDPKRLDPGVKKWVSMAEALGWGKTAPSPTFCNSGHGGAGIEWGGNSTRKAMREQSATGEDWEMKDGVEPGTNDAIRVSPEDAAALQTYPTAWVQASLLDEEPTLGRGLTDRPSPTVTGGGTETGGAEPVAKWHERYTGSEGWQGPTDRLSTEEAAALQTYPSGWGFTDRPAVTVGNAVGRGLIGGSGAKETVEKAIEDGTFISSTNGDGTSYAEKTRITVDEAAALQSYPNQLRPEVEAWKWVAAPATTVAGDPRITAREHHYHGEQSKTSLTLEQGEASALQTFPDEPPFIWKGTKSKVFLQIGNAVPPLMATRILEALLR